MEQLQLDLSRKLRDDGIKRSVTNADTVHKNWSEIAYDFLKGYIEINPVFMVEDVRFASQGIVPSPPSQRAWGAIIVRAAKAGLIWQDGFRKVKNAKAHCTPAAVWKSRIVKRY